MRSHGKESKYENEDFKPMHYYLMQLNASLIQSLQYFLINSDDKACYTKVTFFKSKNEIKMS